MKKITAILSMIALLGCSSSEERYSSNYVCAFSFNTALHATSELTRTLTNPGMFVIVDVKREKGIHRLSIRPNNTNPVETTYLTTEEENRAIGNVGADGLLIIGCTTFNGLAAYDGQCPYCLANSTSRQFPLSFEAHGQAVSCSTCHRRYELNYSGTSSDGTRLIEYRVWIEGAFLRVTNG